MAEAATTTEWKWRAGTACRDEGGLHLHLEVFRYGERWHAFVMAQRRAPHYRDARTSGDGMRSERAAKAWAEDAVPRVLAALEEPVG